MKAMLFSYVLLFWPAHFAKTRLVDEELANNMCGKLGWFISSADDHCCNNPSGHYLVKPCNITQCPNETISKPCPFDPNDPANQTYIPDANNRTECIPANGANYCNSFNNTHRVDGSRTENSKCICDDGFSSATDDVTGGCHEHVPCKPGFQPFRLGNLTHSPQCEECPNGTFSSVHSVTELCHFLKNYTTNQEKNIANSTHDTDCIEQGKKGRFKFTKRNQNSGKKGRFKFTKRNQNSGLPQWAFVLIGIVIGIVVAGGIFVIAWKKGRFKFTKRNQNSGSADPETPEDENVRNEADSGISSSVSPPPSCPSLLLPRSEQYQTTQLVSRNNGNREDIPQTGTIPNSSELNQSNQSNATTSRPPRFTPMERRNPLSHADSNHPPMQNAPTSTAPSSTAKEHLNQFLPADSNHPFMQSDTESSEKVSLLSREGEERSEGEPPPV